MEEIFYWCGFDESDIVTEVLKQNEEIFTNSCCRTSMDFRKMCFICNDKRISDNECGIRRSEIDCAKEHLIEWRKYNKSSCFYDHFLSV